MTDTIEPFTAMPIQQQQRIGYLLRPFGWAAGTVAAMLQSDPTLAADLIGIDRSRMHLIALVLAYLDQAPSADVAALLLRRSIGEVLDRLLGYRPQGITRALRHLPKKVLDPAEYRQLLQLLADAEAANVLYHRTEIDADTIAVLIGVPAGLRRIVMASSKCLLRSMGRLADSLALLVSRGAGQSVEAIVADLMMANHPGQFVAKVKSLIEALPLPDGLPPPCVGKARRLDRPSEVKHLAKAWRNCLALYAERIDDGKYAIYVWDDADAPAVCLIERAGRFGWVVEAIKGPRNVDLRSNALDVITAAFADVGIPQAEIVRPLQTIIEM
jgi:hypothetical protein